MRNTDIIQFTLHLYVSGHKKSGPWSDYLEKWGSESRGLSMLSPQIKKSTDPQHWLWCRLSPLHLSVSGLHAGGGGGQVRGGVTSRLGVAADRHGGGVTGHPMAGRLDSRLIVRPPTAIQRNHYKLSLLVAAGALRYEKKEIWLKLSDQKYFTPLKYSKNEDTRQRYQENKGKLRNIFLKITVKKTFEFKVFQFSLNRNSWIVKLWDDSNSRQL